MAVILNKTRTEYEWTVLELLLRNKVFKIATKY